MIQIHIKIHNLIQETKFNNYFDSMLIKFQFELTANGGLIGIIGTLVYFGCLSKKMSI